MSRSGGSGSWINGHVEIVDAPGSVSKVGAAAERMMRCSDPSANFPTFREHPNPDDEVAAKTGYPSPRAIQRRSRTVAVDQRGDAYDIVRVDIHPAGGDTVRSDRALSCAIGEAAILGERILEVAAEDGPPSTRDRPEAQGPTRELPPQRRTGDGTAHGKDATLHAALAVRLRELGFWTGLSSTDQQRCQDSVAAGEYPFNWGIESYPADGEDLAKGQVELMLDQLRPGLLDPGG